MLPFLILLPAAQTTPPPVEDSLLAAVPTDAYLVAHCTDVAAVRRRLERNDWYRLLGRPLGEPLARELVAELRRGTHSDTDELFAIARGLEGEAVFFDTRAVAGFVAEPPADRAALVELVREWMPAGDPRANRTLELEGGEVQLVAWPDDIGGWTERAGHFAAFVDHPGGLAVLSGDSADALRAALTECVTGLDTRRRAPVVERYLEEGGGASGGVELFVDLTPLVPEMEQVLRRAVDGVLPDPTSLLGLERGTWAHVTVDVRPGTDVDCFARVRVPPDTLASRLADTFAPLPRALPSDLPSGIWALGSLHWDVKEFYRRTRAAFEEAGRGEGLDLVDSGIDAARGVTGIDPIVDVLDQLAGDVALYFGTPPEGRDDGDWGMELALSMGLHAGLVNGDAFLSAVEQLIDAGALGDTFEMVELAGVEAYVLDEPGGVDGGLAFLPRAFALSPARPTLLRALHALTRVEGASVGAGSRLLAEIDGNAGACGLLYVEMTPVRRYALDDVEGDVLLPPVDDDAAPRDPFDSLLVGTARRTQDGFELRLRTR